MVDEHRIVALLGDANKFWADKPLPCQSMTTGAIDAEQFTAVFGGSMEIQAGAHVRILTGVAKHPKHENDAGCSRKHNEGCDETTTFFGLFSCS